MEVTRVRYVTRRYPQLQGLRLLPLAAVFLLSGLWRAGWLPLPPADHASATAWFLGGLAAAVSLSFVIRAWYTKRYGAVSQGMLHSGVVPLTALLIGLLLATWLQDQWHWVYPVPALFVGTALLANGLSHGAMRKHYVVIAVLWFAVASLALFGVSASTREAALDVTIGVALVIAGLGDHWLLRDTLQPVSV
jgi:hypothetical protein